MADDTKKLLKREDDFICPMFTYNCHGHAFDGSPWQQYFHIERDPNGLGEVLHLFPNEISPLHLQELPSIAHEFLKLAFIEDEEAKARFVMAIVHEGSKDTPHVLTHLVEENPQLMVKSNVSLSDHHAIRSLPLCDYYEELKQSYKNGLSTTPPMHQITMTGKLSEEVGFYCEKYLNALERNCFMGPTLPWGSLSMLHGKIDRKDSDDGPICWTRPGEQMLSPSFARRRSSSELVAMPSPKKQRCKRELMALTKTIEPREIRFEDRTRPHADHVEGGLYQKTTAAAGFVQCSVTRHDNCSHIVKDVICFQAEHYDELVRRLQLDVHEPPYSQCLKFLDMADLNALRRDGVRFSSIALRNHDLYFIPRNVVHQFRSSSAVTSVAWHVRLKYYNQQQPTQTPEIEHLENNVKTTSNESCNEDGSIVVEKQQQQHQNNFIKSEIVETKEEVNGGGTTTPSG